MRVPFLVLLAACVLSFGGCSGKKKKRPDPGALVRVTISSQVGVLLEDFPEASRDRIAEEILARPAAWWTERAQQQLRLTSIRLVYRKYYFDESEWDSKNALTLPPEGGWNVTVDAGGAARTTVDGHDVVAVGFEFEGTLLTDAASPGVSEPQLRRVGGTWDEEFVFPVDPTLIMQRTGMACLSEDQFPPESLDAEDAFRFYDDTCEVEVPGEQYCHHTEPLPTESCVEALERVVGRVETAVHYERIAWDAALADSVRSGELTTPDAPDLKVLTEGEGLNDHRVIYKYVPSDHCAVVEECVGGSGWRRLLIFDSHDHNVGGAPLHIGPVDYYVEGLGGELVDHHVYELSDCHGHFHFEFYGDFSFGGGGGVVQKNGFCIESTDRLSNNETSPLHTSYDCENQGADPGWGDLYGSSLTCNWIDVTDVDTSAGPVTDTLEFRSNPDGFLCEGTLVLDASGAQVWEPTEFTTDAGDVIDRPACDETPGAEKNDVGQVDATIPGRGGFVSSPCRDDHDLGPLRNCGFEMQTDLPACTPGEAVTLSCTGGDDARPQVVRICETSRVLGTGVDCTHVDALANVVVAGDAAEVTFDCPDPRDADEPGGQYAIYVAPVWEPDGAVALTCAP